MDREKCKLPHWIPEPLPNQRPGAFLYKGRNFIYEVVTGWGGDFQCYRTPRDFQEERENRKREKIWQKKETLYHNMFGKEHTEDNEFKFNEFLKDKYKRVTGEYINPVLDELPEWLLDDK